jgi:hypothetical protein
MRSRGRSYSLGSNTSLYARTSNIVTNSVSRDSSSFTAVNVIQYKYGASVYKDLALTRRARRKDILSVDQPPAGRSRPALGGRYEILIRLIVTTSKGYGRFRS